AKDIRSRGCVRARRPRACRRPAGCGNGELAAYRYFRIPRGGSSMAQPCRLIELGGSPYDRGVQYGRQASPEISRSIGHYGSQLAAGGVDERQLTEIVARYL